MNQLAIGLTKTQTTTVSEENTAIAMKSGSLPVFATPAMTALMEYAAASCVEEKLADGATTVGIALDIAHLAATPLGCLVTATAELCEIDGRKLTFNVEAKDETQIIGKGKHVRFIVDKEKFMAKASKK
jgi:predicted thioesterase